MVGVSRMQGGNWSQGGEPLYWGPVINYRRGGGVLYYGRGASFPLQKKGGWGAEKIKPIPMGRWVRVKIYWR